MIVSVTVTAFSIAHPGRTSVGPPLGCQDAPNTTHTLYQAKPQFYPDIYLFHKSFLPAAEISIPVSHARGWPGCGVICWLPGTRRQVRPALHYLVAKHWKNDLIFVGTYSGTKICKVPMLVTYLDILYIVHTYYSIVPSSHT